MAAIGLLEKYGIKEVADVVFYEINADGTKGKPVLFLDTLKISTIEQTADQAEARGGKGNSPLIIWDYGKELNVNIEDALYSPQSMSVMFGGAGTTPAEITSVNRFEKVTLSAAITSMPTDGTKYYDVANLSEITTTTGLSKGAVVYKDGAAAVAGHQIVITAQNFPGTYCLVGETYARNKNTGKDEYFQFEIPQAKMGAENNITLEAEGDPSVFNMNMRVLRPDNGEMMILRQYTIS